MNIKIIFALLVSTISIQALANVTEEVVVHGERDAEDRGDYYMLSWYAAQQYRKEWMASTSLNSSETSGSSSSTDAEPKTDREIEKCKALANVNNNLCKLDAASVNEDRVLSCSRAELLAILPTGARFSPRAACESNARAIYQKDLASCDLTHSAKIAKCYR